ncbi:dynein light chain, cytosolic [Mytilinidion resinicola]|uniref:Dynein light chain, cytosolic n=1 Tax=Mytilinidion resinicola TaxID=574789 RepID=A0A6A6YNS7_9PEZI|nr:dynein light chain, cytosolic [Mytilinidion resinicola]KAF2809517.1 dynein light chain, cytosolic [Mytilinidion resinicola]
MTSPVTTTRLQQIATDACESAIGSSEGYNHSSVAAWNTAIINGVLRALISETSSTTNAHPPFKYAVNSTIIQHITPSPGVAGESGSTGRRGMHSAMGAYWNNDRDGMWSWKYDGGEKKGMDIVVSVMWVAV